MKKSIELSIEDLGKLIKQERKNRNMTQTELGELSGASINFISQIEAGKPTAHIGKVFRALQVLGYEMVFQRGSRGLVIPEKEFKK
jgi:y4mF family transcriptional regulator